MEKNKRQSECKAAQMREGSWDKCGCSYGTERGRRISCMVRKEKQRSRSE